MITAVGERFVAALRQQSWADLADCFHDDVIFNALIPGGLRGATDRAAAARYLQQWFGDADQLVLMTSRIEPMHDRLHITYRFRAHEDLWYVVEQQLYCTIRDGRIARADLLCSGFRPEGER